MKFLTPREASVMSGLPYAAILDRLQPEHPDHIPSRKFLAVNGAPRYRIDEQTFREWLEAHEVRS